MTTFHDRPPTLSASIAATAALVAVIATAPGGAMSVGLGALGLPVFAIGAFRGRRGIVSVGGLVLVSGALLSGVYGAPTPAVLVSMAATFVAWDVAEHGVGLGAQVGHQARSRNAVVAHAGGSALVAGVTLIGALALFTASPGGRPLTALLLLLVGAVIIAVTLTE